MDTELQELRENFQRFKSETQKLADKFSRLMTMVDNLLSSDEASKVATALPAQRNYQLDTPKSAPPCPLCEGPTVERTRKADGKKFWGCANFPDCRGVAKSDNRRPAAWRNSQSLGDALDDADGKLDRDY